MRMNKEELFGIPYAERGGVCEGCVYEELCSMADGDPRKTCGKWKWHTFVPYWENYLVEAYVGRHSGNGVCLLYTSPSPRDLSTSRMPSSA